MINIEICKSIWKEGTWCVRIGDIEGCIEHSNASLDEILEDIKSKMLQEKEDE